MLHAQISLKVFLSFKAQLWHVALDYFKVSVTNGFPRLLVPGIVMKKHTLHVTRL
jgi:hypothetical protein